MAGAIDPWTRYWSSGRLDACAADAGGRYFPEIRDRWWRFFADLDPGSSVLDVATGNGAVLAVAAEYAAQNDVTFELVGVDRAHPEPGKVRSRAERAGCTLELRGDTAVEDLPFPPDRFHAVTAQFALEYTDTGRSLDEIADVLAPEGRLMMIGHRADSDVAAQARRDREDVQFVRRPGGLLDRLDALVAAEIDGGAFADSMRSSPTFLEARAAFNDEAAAVMARAGGRDAVQRRFLESLLSSMGELYQHRAHHPLDLVLDKLWELREEVVAHGDRTDDLLRAALTRDDRAELRDGLERRGFDIVADAPVRRRDGAMLGHEFGARRG